MKAPQKLCMQNNRNDKVQLQALYIPTNQTLRSVLAPPTERKH